RIGVEGSDILYVGDHIYSDAHVSKGVRRWRTAVIMRELESELLALDSFTSNQEALDELMAQKIKLEFEYSQIRLQVTRRQGEPDTPDGDDRSTDLLQSAMQSLRSRLVALDNKIAPLAQISGRLNNDRWG